MLTFDTSQNTEKNSSDTENGGRNPCHKGIPQRNNAQARVCPKYAPKHEKAPVLPPYGIKAACGSGTGAYGDLYRTASVSLLFNAVIGENKSDIRQ